MFVCGNTTMYFPILIIYITVLLAIAGSGNVHASSKVEEENTERAFQKMKKVWPTREQLINLAEKGTNVRKSGNLDTRYQRRRWLMCDPGTYMTAYSFTRRRSSCRASREGMEVTKHDWGIPFDSIDFACTNIDGKHLNWQVPSARVQYPHGIRDSVDNPNFFKGIVMADHYKISLKDCLTRVSHFLMSKGFVAHGANLKVVSLPERIQIMPDDHPMLKEKSNSKTYAEFQEILRKIKYDIHEYLCEGDLVVCGMQPATNAEIKDEDISTISVFCCRRQYFCARSTYAVEIYKDEPLDMTTTGDDEDEVLKTFTITAGKQISKSRVEGGSLSATITHAANKEVELSLGAQGALGGSIKASYSTTHASTEDKNWVKTFLEVDHPAKSTSVSFRLANGALNTVRQVQVRCGIIDVFLKEIMHIVIVQGGPEYCNAEVKWIFQAIYTKGKNHARLPLGTNFSHPAQQHLNVYEGGSPYIPLQEVTSTFLHRFIADKELKERLETSRDTTLEKVMNKYAGSRSKVDLPLKSRDGSPLPYGNAGGLLFQQIGVCNHRAQPEKYQFTVYTDNFRGVSITSTDCSEITDKFEAYETYSNPRGLTKTYVRDRVRRGLTILNLPKDLTFPEASMGAASEIVKKLQSNFKEHGRSKSTGVDWSAVAQDTWRLEEVINRPLKVSVPANTKVVFYKLVGKCGRWVYTLDIDAYEIIRDGCAISSMGFTSVIRPTKKCETVDNDDFSCTPVEKFKRTRPKEVQNLGSKGLHLKVEYAVGTVDPMRPLAEIPDQHHDILFESFAKLGVGPLTSLAWNKIGFADWESGPLVNHYKELYVPPQIVVEAFQIVGVCGQYQIHSNILYLRYLMYDEVFQGGHDLVNGTGPFSNPDFHIPFSAILTD